MTTIAGCADRGVLVSDTQVADGDQKWAETKVERIAGCLYGAAGDSSDCDKFIGWAKRSCRGRRPRVAESFQALALTPDGLFFFDTNLHPMQMKQPFAIGSGSKAARAAMIAGADIRRAVEIACEVDAGSSLPVQTFHLKEEKTQ